MALCVVFRRRCLQKRSDKFQCFVSRTVQIVVDDNRVEVVDVLDFVPCSFHAFLEGVVVFASSRPKPPFELLHGRWADEHNQTLVGKRSFDVRSALNVDIQQYGPRPRATFHFGSKRSVEASRIDLLKLQQFARSPQPIKLGGAYEMVVDAVALVRPSPAGRCGNRKPKFGQPLKEAPSDGSFSGAARGREHDDFEAALG